MCDHVNKQFKNYIVKTTISDNTPSIIFIFDFDNEHVLLKAEYGNPPITTLNEISWYNKINYKPVSLFITSVYNNNIAAIFLKYKLKADTIDNLVEKKKLNSEQICITFYKNEKLLKKLFYNNDTHKVDFADRDRHYSLKYKNRMGSQFITQRLKECLNIDPIIINDKVYRPINECIGHIINQRKLHDYLTPTHHGIIHGDLHFGNVLLEKDKYYWVDPNGDMQMPIEYDYGKMFHSIHGGYGRIIKNGFFLKQISKHQFEFFVDMPIEYKDSYHYISKNIESGLVNRILYAEAMHFATMLPHHQKNKLEMEALLLQSTILFNELLEKIK